MDNPAILTPTDASSTPTHRTQTREDMKKGVYVEGLTEEAVDSPHQAYQVLTRGYRNRHVGETAMNRCVGVYLHAGLGWD